MCVVLEGAMGCIETRLERRVLIRQVFWSEHEGKAVGGTVYRKPVPHLLFGVL